TKCSAYDGTKPSPLEGSESLDFDGPLQEQIDGAISFVNARIRKREFHPRGGSQIETLTEYSTISTREIIINAICHKDYSIQNQPVQIQIFKDRIEVVSPGTWFAEKLEPGRIYRFDELSRTPPSVLRNPTLAQALYRSARFEGRGRGIPFSIQESIARGAPLP